MKLKLPPELIAVLPPDTARAWTLIHDQLPKSMVLYGGTAITVHLHHRISRDLDFFFDDPAVNLQQMLNKLESLRTTAVTYQDDRTLNAIFGETKVQFLSAVGQHPVGLTTNIAGIRVASLRDLAATKVKVIGDRGELRDYYDLMVVEQLTSITAESALLDYQERYRDKTQLAHLVGALGYLGDVGDDPTLPITRDRIESYWHSRQHSLLAALDSTGLVRRGRPATGHPTPPPAPIRTANTSTESSDGDSDGMVWVDSHNRDGRQVKGYWRRR